MGVKWQGPDGVLAHAAAIVRSYDTSVTLRQLFYRLVADQTLPNTRSYYQSLSSCTAEARREGSFPDLLDRTSRIEEPGTFTGPDEALTWLINDMYRLDRTEGQEWQVWLGVEKAGISAQLDAWFTEPLGIPHVALGGYPSQTLCDQVARRIGRDVRPSVLIYAGDHDPTGEDIDRDFDFRTGFDKVIRVALNAEQLASEDIPPNMLDPAVTRKLLNDSRAAGFQTRHGYLDQYEVDALPPSRLRALYQEAINQFWDQDAYESVLAQEEADRETLRGER